MLIRIAARRVSLIQVAPSANRENVELETVQAHHLDDQVRLPTDENLAARLPLFVVTHEQLRFLVDGLWITRNGLDDDA